MESYSINNNEIMKDMENVTKKRPMAKVKTNDSVLGTPVTTDISAVYKKLRSGDNAQRVKKIAYRAAVKSLDGKRRSVGFAEGDALPYLLFGATFGKSGLDDVRTMTRLVLLSISCKQGFDHAEQLKQRVSQLPNTLLAFVGSSQKTLKVVVECRYDDGREPLSTEEYAKMLAEGHKTAARLYEALAECEVEPAVPGVAMGCRMSDDPTAFYQPDAQPLIIFRRKEQDVRGVELSKQGEVIRQQSDKEALRLKMEYYACVDRACEESTTAEERVQALAHYCRMAHLPEEFCLHETMMHWLMTPVDDELKRRIFRTVYKEAGMTGKPVSQMNEKERIARFIKDFFERRYELRYNEVKRIEEFRPKGNPYYDWQPLTKRDMKRIAFEEMMEGGFGWSVDIETYVQSSLVDTYNPIREFLYATIRHYDSSHDYIGELARRVPTEYADWERYFHRWFLAMVAQWLGMSRDFGNAVVPMLIGRQGTHKSTFCKLLLPRALREYFMDDIKMDNAEQVERVLGRMALVNIDEYNAKTPREQAKIKRLLTEHDVQVRQMRSDQYTLTSRLCSFIATTNDMQPLPGGDGTRRYLCVEVTDVINTETPIDYRRLYAQALHELDEGQPYRFFPHEEAEIQEHNKPYQQQTSVEEVLQSFFAPAGNKAANFMKAVDIQKTLAKHLKAGDVPNIKLLAVTLKRCGFSNGSQKGQRGWYVRQLTDEV